MTGHAALQGALRARMTRWAEVPIGTAIGWDDTGRRPDETLVSAFADVEAPDTSWLRSDRTAAELGHRAHDWLLHHNQFCLVSRDTMVAMYADRLRVVADDLDRGGEAVERLLTRHLDAHHERFRRLVVADLGPAPAEAVAAEYSPQLQVQALGLLDLPAGPVLDVGCGRHAALVRHLRAAGVPAVGLDLHASACLAVQADWLDVDYGARCWATVTSHLGFALHFLHHHHAGRPIAERYAQAYMRILRSLPPGGTFAYVPSLPFIEDLLDPARWPLRRSVVPGTRVTRTHVRRRTPDWESAVGEDTP